MEVTNPTDYLETACSISFFIGDPYSNNMLAASNTITSFMVEK